MCWKRGTMCYVGVDAYHSVCCSMLQCVAVCCNLLQYVAVGWSELERVGNVVRCVVWV